MTPEALEESLSAWCSHNLGAAPAETLFDTGHLSRVLGLRLTNSVRVVLKLREPAPRLYECFAVQRHLYEYGYPCPRPLDGPTVIAGLLLTAEAFVEGGMTEAGTVSTAPRYAEALYRQVRAAAGYRISRSLAPEPPWLGGWDHDTAGLWPEPDDPLGDLNAVAEPAWLDEIARRVKPLLRASSLPRVVGHADWHAGNLLWQEGRLHAVFDWDSLAYLSEAAFAGGAAVIYTASNRAEAGLEETRAFLRAYEVARSKPFTSEETRIAWAAGLWNLAFDAKKQTIDGIGGGLEQLQHDAEERLRMVDV